MPDFEKAKNNLKKIRLNLENLRVTREKKARVALFVGKHKMQNKILMTEIILGTLNETENEFG